MAERGSVAAASTPEGASTHITEQTTVQRASNGHTSLSNGVKVETFPESNKDENMGGDEQTTKSHMQDIPLDFSVKRKSVESISESLTDESQVSSVSPPASHDSQEPFLEPRSNESVSNGSSRSLDHIGEPRISGMSPNSIGMGYLPGMGPGLLPNGNLPPLPPFMDQRLLQGSKNTRPFKAYPKEALSMPLGYLGSAGFPMPQLDDPSLHGVNLSPDELMNIYKQQIQVLRERDKQLMALAKQHSPVETTSSHRNGISNSSHHSHIHSHSSSSNTSTTHDDNINSNNNNNGTTTSPSMPTAVSSPVMFTPPASRPGPMVSSTSALTAAGRKRPRSLPDEQKDSAYWERRRKNNDAAKRSRDARRAKEDEIAIRAALLEQENLKLRVEVAALKTETARLRCMLYNS